jgi:hypothetical protein
MSTWGLEVTNFPCSVTEYTVWEMTAGLQARGCLQLRRDRPELQDQVLPDPGQGGHQRVQAQQGAHHRLAHLQCHLDRKATAPGYLSAAEQFAYER